jgi:enoyl-CoA hydratase
MAITSFELRDDIGVLTMDDGKVNALGPDMLSALAEGLERAETDAQALVLTGRAGRFSAGFDLKIMMSGLDAAKDLLVRGADVLMRAFVHPQPLVVACSGHAIAGGALLLSVGDVRIGAAGDFKIGLNEVANSMPVPILAHELARARLDVRELDAAVLFAKMYDPEAAARAGWLDRVVEPKELLESAINEARALAALPALAYAMSKRSLRRGVDQHIRETLESNIQEFGVG